VKLAVRAADVSRAKGVMNASGALPGHEPQEPVDIPEEEWSRLPVAEPDIPRIRPKPMWPRTIIAGAPLLFAAIIAAVVMCMGG
jgi:hypothetical protein